MTLSLTERFSILIAEDDPNDALLLKRAIRKVGLSCPVSFVEDGEEAISYLEGRGEFADRSRYPRPGCIILDLKMPRKSGLDVLAWLREHPHVRVIPTIVLSSSGQEQDVLRSYELGANTFMVKPGNFIELERMVRVIHEYWQIAQKVNPSAVAG